MSATHYNFKTVNEKVIFEGENKKDKSMLFKRMEIKFKSTQNIFLKSTNKIIYSTIKMIEKKFPNCFIQLFFNFYRDGIPSRTLTQEIKNIDKIIGLSYNPRAIKLRGYKIEEGQIEINEKLEIYNFDIESITKNKEKYIFDDEKIQKYKTQVKNNTFNTIDEGESHVLFVIGDIDYMIVYIEPYTKQNTQIVGCNNDNKNDCMFESIKTSVGFYNMPKFINTNKKFKKYFEVEENELFPLSHKNIYDLEKIFNKPIIIKNWKLDENFNHYIDVSNSNSVITLKIENENHIDIQIKNERFYDNKDEKELVIIRNNKSRKGILVYKYNLEKKQIETFNGEEIIYYDVKYFNEEIKKKNEYYFEEQRSHFKTKTVIDIYNETLIQYQDLKNVA